MQFISEDNGVNCFMYKMKTKVLFLTCIALDIRCVDLVIGDIERRLRWDSGLQSKLFSSLFGVSSKSSSSIIECSLHGVTHKSFVDDFRFSWMEDDFRSIFRSMKDGHFKLTMLTPFISLLVMNRPLFHSGVVAVVFSTQILLRSGSDLWNDLKSLADLLTSDLSPSLSASCLSSLTLNATVFLLLQLDVFCNRFRVSLSNSNESTSSSLKFSSAFSPPSSSSFFVKDSVTGAIQSGAVTLLFKAFNALAESIVAGDANDNFDEINWTLLSDCNWRGMYGLWKSCRDFGVNGCVRVGVCKYLQAK